MTHASVALARGESFAKSGERHDTLIRLTWTIAARWRELRRFLPAPGFCSEVMTIFVAEELTAVPGGGLAADDDEEFELLRLSPGAILRGGEVTDGKTLLAAALLSLEH